MTVDGHEPGSEFLDTQLRVRAPERVLTEKGYFDPAIFDRIVETYETRIGPHIGARIVARAWADPGFKAALVADGTAAVRGFGHDLTWTGHLTAVENTPVVHNMVVCTLCSCYPQDILGHTAGMVQVGALPLQGGEGPPWVLENFGVSLGDEVDIRVWDSTAEMRYLGVPMRPEGTESLTEEDLASTGPRETR